MTHTKKLLAVLGLVALFGTSTVAFAQMNGSQQGMPPQGGFQGQHGPGGPGGWGGPGRMGSSTWQGAPGMREGSSTWSGGMRVSGMHGIPGEVSEIDSSSFLLATHGFGKDMATTTYTVNISSSTKFMHGSTTAAFGDLIVGNRVAVVGQVATSTKTITAEIVMTGIGGGPGMRGDSGQSGPMGGKAGLLDKFKSFLGLFGGKGNDQSNQESQSNGGPATPHDIWEFISSLFH